MAAVIRLARTRATWLPVLPATMSWALLFGYQWAFYFAYHGHERTVLSYWSGVLGDGFVLPVLNVAAFVTLRQLAFGIPWSRAPVYAMLGTATATAAFLVQAHLDLVNWSMPAPFRWSDIGQFHFFVMSAEIAYLYLTFATAIENWSRLRADGIAWRAFASGWVCVGLFATTVIADYVRL